MSCFPKPDYKLLKVRTWSIVYEARTGMLFSSVRLVHPPTEPLACGLLDFPEWRQDCSQSLRQGLSLPGWVVLVQLCWGMDINSWWCFLTIYPLIVLFSYSLLTIFVLPVLDYSKLSPFWNLQMLYSYCIQILCWLLNLGKPLPFSAFLTYFLKFHVGVYYSSFAMYPSHSRAMCF